MCNGEAATLTRPNLEPLLARIETDVRELIDTGMSWQLTLHGGAGNSTVRLEIRQFGAVHIGDERGGSVITTVT